MLQAQHASAGFRDVGDVSGLRRPLERYIAQAGSSMAHAGSLQAAFVEQRNADDTRQQSIALSYQVNVGHGSLGVNASRTTGDTRDTSYYVFYSLPLGDRSSSSTSARYDSQQQAPKGHCSRRCRRVRRWAWETVTCSPQAPMAAITPSTFARSRPSRSTWRPRGTSIRARNA